MDLQALLSSAIADHRAGRLDQAEVQYQSILSVDPSNPHALHLLGLLYHQTARNPQSIDLLRRAISLEPDIAAFHCNLGMVLAKLNDFPEAISHLERAIQLQPDSADAHGNLANVYKQTGEIERAIDLAQRATTLKKDPRLAGNLLYMLYFDPACDPSQIAAAHRAWARAFADPLAPFIRPHDNPRQPDRRLKIGFVLPFLADHPVLRFLLPYFQHHSRDLYEIICYYDKGDPAATGDTIVPHLLNLAIDLRTLSGLPDSDAADRIRRDQIDILFDLSMHTEDNRLPTFALKPAPVQITWLAYAGSTGLNTVDYRLTDPFLDPPVASQLDPPDANPTLYSETSLYLESFWCYWPPPEAPPVGPLPASSNRFMTFGSLNNYAKVSRATLELWSRVVSAVPDSRLLLYCPPGPGRDRALSHFTQTGIAPHRITFAGPMKPSDYFARYNRIDIALDPFPYAGGTTTCDALWMGVPVVTLSGKTAVSRAGVSILSNAGLPELIATTPDAYTYIATSLASNLPFLAHLRSTLRPRVQSSRLADASRFTHVFEQSLRRAWVAYCQKPS